MRTKIDNLPPEGEGIELRGRIVGRRDFGGVIFLDLRDDTGITQIALQKRSLGDLSSHNLSYGDIVSVQGNLFRTKNGTNTLDIKSYEVYSKPLSPLPDKWAGISDRRNCYDNRGLEILTSDETFNRFRKVNGIVSHIRNYFFNLDYQEVDTGILQKDEDASPSSTFTTYCNDLARNLILRKSKEQRMKQLIVGGFEKIFEIGKSFRNEQITSKYHPEINGLELYCTYSNWNDMLELTEGLLISLNERFGTTSSNPQDYFKINFYDLVSDVFRIDGRTASLETICSLIPQKRLRNYKPNDTGRAFALMDLAGEGLEKYNRENIVLMGVPKQISVLSKSSEVEPTLAEEFRYFVQGTSFCYGNTELTDPNEQENRLKEQATYENKKLELDKDPFLKLMRIGMPPLGGLGIGLDRLLSIYTESKSIKDVIYFPL